MPSRGHRVRAWANASWVQSSARSRSRVSRTVVARTAAHSSRNARATRSSTTDERGPESGMNGCGVSDRFDHRPYLDACRVRRLRLGQQRSQPDGFVEVSGLDEVEAAHDLFGLHERRVRDVGLLAAPGCPETRRIGHLCQLVPGEDSRAGCRVEPPVPLVQTLTLGRVSIRPRLLVNRRSAADTSPFLASVHDRTRVVRSLRRRTGGCRDRHVGRIHVVRFPRRCGSLSILPSPHQSYM